MKVAVITGGIRGIGKVISDCFTKNNYSIVTLGRSSFETDHLHLQCDIEKEENVKRAFTTISKEFNHIDVLVNAAGINKDSVLLKCSQEDIVSQLNTNLVGAMLTSKHALRLMMSRKHGSIINIGSVVGERGNAGQCAYSASKAGLGGFTKALAKEVASRNIQVNLIAPGFITSDMTSHLEGAKAEQLKKAIPLREFGDPQHVADLVLFLAQSSYITGQTVYCDGGLHLTL